tara:strand:- start:1020 stop:1625 length:606 start_codon:yes stop_codon:yes gene_type:complete
MTFKLGTNQQALFPIFCLLFFLTSCYEVGEERKACLADENLRVQIGETVLSLPKKDIIIMVGPDAQWYGEPEYSNKKKATSICQRKAEAPFRLESIFFSLIPTECKRKNSQGYCSNLTGYIYKKTAKQLKTQEEKQQLYIHKCKEDPYFDTCRYDVTYKDIEFYFQYYYTSYPLDDIEYLENTALEYFKNHDTTSLKEREQ